MKTILCLFLSLVLPGLAAAQTNDPSVSEVKAVVADMTELLEAGKHREFIEKYAPPAALQEMKDKGRFDEIVHDFKEGKAERLLALLKQAATMAPTVDASGAVTYTDPDWQRPLVFNKIDGRWYLAN
jgi:hypothetical protein